MPSIAVMLLWPLLGSWLGRRMDTLASSPQTASRSRAVNRSASHGCRPAAAQRDACWNRQTHGQSSELRTVTVYMLFTACNELARLGYTPAR
jgi:hypothetical protein